MDRSTGKAAKISAHATPVLATLPVRQRTPAPERQRAYGYLRKDLLPVESEVNRTKERIDRFAKTSGYEIAAVFVEECGKWPHPVAFERLVQAIFRDRVEVVIVPSLVHFAGLGSFNSFKEHFEAATQARVVCALEPLSS
ncbi:recombinase family protein [Kribbella speibonae]|uniref:Recombinase family protein n=1 Tax=Kribbella speibonae TaxID=1572660 RepID=A0A4R0IRR6_9ACTN|nr:recombinase family protein [Kribbella speibonae]TCC36493.1 recombinase family protein [Kribbella speibonae]